MQERFRDPRFIGHEDEVGPQVLDEFLKATQRVDVTGDCPAVDRPISFCVGAPIHRQLMKLIPAFQAVENAVHNAREAGMRTRVPYGENASSSRRTATGFHGCV